MTTWDGSFEATPAGGNKPSLGPSVIRATKQAIRERFSKEHTQDPASGLEAEDGFHRQGSAVTYFQLTAPTTRPDGSTLLTAEDNGRLWVSGDSGNHQLWIYKHPAWVSPMSQLEGALATAQADIQTAKEAAFMVQPFSAGDTVGAEVTIPILGVGQTYFLKAYGHKNGTTETVSFKVPSGCVYRWGLIMFAMAPTVSTLVAAEDYLRSGNGEVTGPDVFFSRSITAGYECVLGALVARVS